MLVGPILGAANQKYMRFPMVERSYEYGRESER